jgi:ionotropic glutamate receptor/U3 small nucleolar RNA-associated protein 19
MKSMLHILGIFSCLCYCTLGQNISVRPDVVNIGALFTFNSIIGRVAKIAIAAAVNDINNDSRVLSGTKLVVQMQDTNSSGFIGIVQGTPLCLSAMFIRAMSVYHWTTNTHIL